MRYFYLLMTVFFDNFSTTKSPKARKIARFLSTMNLKSTYINLLCAPVFYLISFENIGIIKKGCSMMLDKFLKALWFWAKSAMIQLIAGFITDKDSGSYRQERAFCVAFRILCLWMCLGYRERKRCSENKAELIFDPTVEVEQHILICSVLSMIFILYSI